MSIKRIYIFDGRGDPEFDRIECWASLVDDEKDVTLEVLCKFKTKDPTEMLRHVLKHIEDGFVIPNDVLEKLRESSQSNCTLCWHVKQRKA